MWRASGDLDFLIYKNLAQNEIGFFIKTFRMGKGLKAKSRKTKQIKSGKNWYK
jgi:hypothetical protein